MKEVNPMKVLRKASPGKISCKEAFVFYVVERKADYSHS